MCQKCLEKSTRFYLWRNVNMMSTGRPLKPQCLVSAVVSHGETYVVWMVHMALPKMQELVITFDGERVVYSKAPLKSY